MDYFNPLITDQPHFLMMTTSIRNSLNFNQFINYSSIIFPVVVFSLNLQLWRSYIADLIIQFFNFLFQH